MNIMHAWCHLYLFNGQEKKRKSKQRLAYPNTLSHTSPQNLHHTYLYSKKSISSIVYVPFIYIQNFLFIVQFKAHGKVAVYGGVYLSKLHVCQFIIWG
jgi:hypothetical protein